MSWHAGKLRFRRLSGAWSTGWSFRIGQGRKSFTLAPTDPLTQVEYASDLRYGQVFNCSTRTLRDGLLPPATPRDSPLKTVSWKTATAGAEQSLIGPDVSWAQLDLLTRSLPGRAQKTPRARAGRTNVKDRHWSHRSRGPGIFREQRTAWAIKPGRTGSRRIQTVLKQGSIRQGAASLLKPNRDIVAGSETMPHSTCLQPATEPNIQPPAPEKGPFGFRTAKCANTPGEHVFPHIAL
jgi:hypothetical protein